MFLDSLVHSSSKCLDLFLGTLSLMAFNLTSKSVLLTRLLTSGILFSPAVDAEVVAKPLTSGFLFSTAAKADFLTKSLTSGIFLSIFTYHPSFSYLVFITKFVVSISFTLTTNLSYSVFLTTSFLTTLLNLARSVGTGVNLSISSLSTSVFQLAEFDFSA